MGAEHRWIRALPVVLVLMLACGPSAPAGQTGDDPCVDAMAAAAAEADNEAAEPLIDATLYACDSVDEWLGALERYPAAMGATSDAELGELEVKTACFGQHEAPVCQDAVREGIDLP